jgi:hypothetical protein
MKIYASRIFLFAAPTQTDYGAQRGSCLAGTEFFPRRWNGRSLNVTACWCLECMELHLLVLWRGNVSFILKGIMRGNTRNDKTLLFVPIGLDTPCAIKLLHKHGLSPSKNRMTGKEFVVACFAYRSRIVVEEVPSEYCLLKCDSA